MNLKPRLNKIKLNNKYNMKLTLGTIAFFAFALTSIHAQDQSSGFRHPLQIQATGLYSKIQVQGNAGDRRDKDDYIRNQNGHIEGEWKAFENLGFSLNTGYTNFQRTDSGSFKGRDRIGFGIKSAWEFDNWLLGGGVLGFSPNSQQPKTETNNPDFFVVRPYLGLGYKIGDFQVQGELHFQTETNDAFRERFNEEFRRHYQAGVSFSYGILESLNLFLEMETRVPYNLEIDTDTRYASVYPGVSFETQDYGTFAVSAGFPIINDRLYDRSVRLQYFYFW
jgi:hypothetical protein